MFRGLMASLLILLCMSLTSYAQQYGIKVKDNSIAGYQSPDTEHRTALQHLKYNILREDRPFIKYFTLYAVPEVLRKDTSRTLNFVVHSIVDSIDGNIYANINKVPGSETLYWVDIRNYGWLNETWEVVAQEEPYILEPWINDEDVNEIIDLLAKTQFAVDGNFVSFNILVRGDWFIYHITDTTAQDDFGRDPLYYVLMYSTLGEPQNLDEFRDAWQIDEDVIEGLKIEQGHLVAQGKSSVAINQRQIAQTRAPLGYYYETSDSKQSTGDNNYLDVLQPFGLSREPRDASEEILTNALGLQVYFLTDGVGNRVEFADPTVARDLSNYRDVRVKTARSCITCHASGLNYVDNQLERVFKSGVTIRAQDFDFQQDVKRYFLGDFDKRLLADKEIYVAAVKKVTGWEPETNAKKYNDFMTWYEAPIDAEQAARETGVPQGYYIKDISITPNGTLASLARGQIVHRRVWEEGDNSPFAESMLILYRSTIVTDSSAYGKGSKSVKGRVKELNPSVPSKDIVTPKETYQKPKVGAKTESLRRNYRIFNINGQKYRGYPGSVLSNSSLFNKFLQRISTIKKGTLVYINNETNNLYIIFYKGIDGKYHVGYLNKRNIQTSTWRK